MNLGLVTLMLVAIIGFVIAKKARPLPDRSGQGLATGSQIQPSSSADSVLKVASFNIQTGKNAHGIRNIHATASLINDQHLIGIQEIYAPTWLNRLGIGQPQLAVLSQQKSFASILCCTRSRWFREHRGNAILSSLPLTRWRIIGLPDYTGKSYRNMTVVEFDWLGTNVIFINTHLHTKVGRQEQLKTVLAEFSKYPVAILVGDFNSQRDTPELHTALEDEKISDAIALGLQEQRDSMHRIDWILTKGFDVVNSTVIEKGVSDHPYYEVSLRLNRNNQTHCLENNN